MYCWTSDAYYSITLLLVFRYFSNSPTTKNSSFPVGETKNKYSLCPHSNLWVMFWLTSLLSVETDFVATTWNSGVAGNHNTILLCCCISFKDLRTCTPICVDWPKKMQSCWFSLQLILRIECHFWLFKNSSRSELTETWKSWSLSTKMTELLNTTLQYQKLTNYKSSTASCWQKTWPLRPFCVTYRLETKLM